MWWAPACSWAGRGCVGWREGCRWTWSLCRGGRGGAAACNHSSCSRWWRAAGGGAGRQRRGWAVPQRRPLRGHWRPTLNPRPTPGLVREKGRARAQRRCALVGRLLWCNLNSARPQRWWALRGLGPREPPARQRLAGSIPQLAAGRHAGWTPSPRDAGRRHGARVRVAVAGLRRGARRGRALPPPRNALLSRGGAGASCGHTCRTSAGDIRRRAITGRATRPRAPPHRGAVGVGG